MPKQLKQKTVNGGGACFSKGDGSFDCDTNANSQVAALKANIVKHEMMKNLITRFFKFYDGCIKTINEDIPKTASISTLTTIQANAMVDQTEIMNQLENVLLFVRQHQIEQHELNEIQMIQQETREWFDKVYKACEGKKTELQLRESPSPPKTGGAYKAAPKKKKTPVAKKPSKKSK